MEYVKSKTKDPMIERLHPMYVSISNAKTVAKYGKVVVFLKTSSLYCWDRFEQNRKVLLNLNTCPPLTFPMYPSPLRLLMGPTFCCSNVYCVSF